MTRATAGPLSSMWVILALALAAPAQGAETETYVALGDSYTAAPLVLMQHGDPIGCGRSDHNYPSLVQLEIEAKRFVDESCSSATTVHMTSPQAVPLGVHAPQFDALADDVGLVTIGIGGNDVGLVGAATTCLALGALSPTGTACHDNFARPGGGDSLLGAVAATAPKIAATLQGIHRRSPGARVLIVGYPAVAPQNGTSCYPLVTLSDDDLSYLNAMLVKTNEMIAAQAAANDAEYVDTFADSVGHDVCTLPPQRWFEGLVPTAPAVPIHPNALGEASMARSVLRVLATDRPPPVLSALKSSSRSYGRGRAISLTYRLNRAAPVTVQLRRTVAGRRSGGRCVAPTRANRSQRSCKRLSRVLSSVTADSEIGANALTIAARDVPRGPGLYRLTATAAGDDDARSDPQVIHVRVRRAG